MTMLDERPPTEEDQRREAKAKLIARYAWRRGLTWPDIRGLPWSSRSRKDLTVLRLVHEAYEESGDPEDRERNPPSSIGSATWARVDFKLLAAELDREQGRPWVPEQDRLDDRGRWLAAAGTTEDPCQNSPATLTDSSSVPRQSDSSESRTPEASAPVAATPTTAPTDGSARTSSQSQPSSPGPTQSEPALTPPTSAPALPTLPRGWAELAALPPLEHDWCIHHPDRRPVVVTRDGGRCGDCPPRRDEWFPTIGMKRDGWGRSLDWTPRSDRSCAPGRCWCGRCPPRAASS